MDDREFPPDFPLAFIKRMEKTKNHSAENIQKAKQAMKMLKEKNISLYKRYKMMSALGRLGEEYSSNNNDNNLKSFFALATVCLQVKGQKYAVSQYLTWLYRDFQTHPVDRMLKCSKVMVIHQDNFLIQDTLEEIALIFAKAVLHDKETYLGVMRFYFAHCMPSARGSASISEMMEGSVYGACDQKVSYNPRAQVDLEAFVLPLLSQFMKKYPDLVELKTSEC